MAEKIPAILPVYQVDNYLAPVSGQHTFPAREPCRRGDRRIVEMRDTMKLKGL